VYNSRLFERAAAAPQGGSMRVLVTGGAGFIGSHTVDALCDAGHEVAVVDDLSSGQREFLREDVTLYEIDIRDEVLAAVFERFKPTHVMHFAAQMDVRVSLERPEHDGDINVLGTIHLLEQCKRFGVEALAFSSTGGAIYGEPAELPASETYTPRPQSHYGVSKMCAEHYIRLYHDLYGLKFCILRYGNVYGPRQNPHGEAGVCAILGNLMLAGKTPVLYGHGAPLRDYVYVGDVVRANLAALARPEGQTVNIGSGRGTSVRELFDHIARFTGFAGEPELKPLRAGEVDKIFLTNDLAREQLGWTPEVELAEGLDRTVEYLRGRMG
jgi:UDP-glucose 4-epimerase